jgi:hypothetical protein
LCYFLYLASPLTLSEVRSMLPPGLTADLAPFSDQQALKSVHPDAQTVARILAGRCSCSLVRQRLADERADERHLRERYRHLGITRTAMIAALERHRRGSSPRPPREGWPVALSKFVVEHARNAGPTLYLLHFEAADSGILPRSVAAPSECSPSHVRGEPDRWLAEGKPILVG